MNGVYPAVAPAVRYCVLTVCRGYASRPLIASSRCDHAAHGVRVFRADSRVTLQLYGRAYHDVVVSLTVCCRSIFHIHNETINIWSHFVGSLLFLGFIFHLLLHSQLMAPLLPPPIGAAVVVDGRHTPAMFQRVVVADPAMVDDWLAASHFPAVSSLQVHLHALKVAAVTLGTGES